VVSVPDAVGLAVLLAVLVCDGVPVLLLVLDDDAVAELDAVLEADDVAVWDAVAVFVNVVVALGDAVPDAVSDDVDVRESVVVTELVDVCEAVWLVD
jgi:hypothetical protein